MNFISSLICQLKSQLPKLAPFERLPRLHRVGPSASLDEYIRKLSACYITAKQDCQFSWKTFYHGGLR